MSEQEYEHDVEIQDTGTFRGPFVEFDVRENEETGSVGVWFRMEIHELWGQENHKDPDCPYEWFDDWKAEGFYSTGYLNLVSGAGELNEVGVRQLMNVGWDGEFSSLVDWMPEPAQFKVDSHVFNKQEKYRIEALYGYDSVPPEGKAKRVADVDAGRASELDKLFRQSVKAVAANNGLQTKKPSKGPRKPAGAK